MDAGPFLKEIRKQTGGILKMLFGECRVCKKSRVRRISVVLSRCLRLVTCPSEFGKMKKESRIFVAGGTGLVGSAIIRNLIKGGYTNVFSNYHRREPPDRDGVSYHRLDLTKQQKVECFFELFQPEYVFFAAAKVGGILANNRYRADFIYSNLVIQNNVIDISCRNNVRKLLFLGSTCIYPKECPQPMREEYLLTAPLEYTNEPYAIAKIAGIKMCESYNLQYGTNFISVMPTNLYGPHDNFDLETSHVLPAIMRKIHLGKALEEGDWETVRRDLDNLPVEGVDGTAEKDKIIAILDAYGIQTSGTDRLSPVVQVEIWGSGKPRREFLWSDDMADACVFLMEHREFRDTIGRDHVHSASVPGESSEEIRNTHINIGTGEDISIRELAEMIKQTIGFQGRIFFNTDKPDGTMQKLTDPSKLHGLGWKHSVDLQDGIRKLYGWYTRSY